MMRLVTRQFASRWGSLFALVLGSGCHVVVEKSDGSGGSTDGSGGSNASGGSVPVMNGGVPASGGAAATNGGVPAANGGSPSNGGSLASGGGTAGEAARGGAAAGGAASVFGAPYVEACGSAEPMSNDDRDMALALGSETTLCLADGADHDWFYVDTPADGKAHILELDFDQEPSAWANLAVFAKADGSQIGTFHSAKGVKASVWVTLGPGARTLLDFTPNIASQALVTVKASMTAENDSYEPNNERAAAATIMSATDISAQMMVPYVSVDQSLEDDWYKVELTAGAHVFRLTSEPEEAWIEVQISDSARVDVASGHPPNRGAAFNFNFSVSAAGTYYFRLASNVGSMPTISTGSKPHFLSESYAFRIE